MRIRVRSRLAPPLATALLLPLLTAAAQAQPLVPARAVRAINLARTTVVRLNGGLSAYRPAQCMFSSPVPTNPCLASDNAEGYRFHFLGGAPAWEQTNRLPSKETEILIDPEGRQVKQVIYNGDLRPASRAISLARSHAIRLNGGPRVYEPGRCMSAPVATRANPCVLRADASGFRFRFQGGAPQWEQRGDAPSLVTELQISADGRSVLDVIENGPPR